MGEGPLTDDCEMPLGKHKGTAMEDVPAPYLILVQGGSETTKPKDIELYRGKLGCFTI